MKNPPSFAPWPWPSPTPPRPATCCKTPAVGCKWIDDAKHVNATMRHLIMGSLFVNF